MLALIWLQLVLGIGSIYWTMHHLEGGVMVQFMGWASGIVRLDPAAAEQIRDVDLIFKLHIILGLFLFLITPFTRLIHIWSVPIWFLFRPGYQIVRSLGAVPRPTSPTRGPVAGGAPSYGGPTVVRQKSESGE